MGRGVGILNFKNMKARVYRVYMAQVLYMIIGGFEDAPIPIPPGFQLRGAKF